jgi:hypothetical protein
MRRPNEYAALMESPLIGSFVEKKQELKSPASKRLSA